MAEEKKFPKIMLDDSELSKVTGGSGNHTGIVLYCCNCTFRQYFGLDQNDEATEAWLAHMNENGHNAIVAYYD